MFSARRFFCLTVLTSSLAFAQAPEKAPPQGESIPYHFHPRAEEPSGSEPIGLKIVAGLGLGIVGGLAGGLIGGALHGGGCGDLSCFGPIMGGMVAGVVLGMPLGVYWVGEVHHEQGSYGMSLVGTAIGTAASLVLVTIAASSESVGVGSVAAVSVLVGPIAGAIVGYDLSRPQSVPLSKSSLSVAPARSGLRWTPVLGLTRAGGLMGGLAGSF